MFGSGPDGYRRRTVRRMHRIPVRRGIPVLRQHVRHARPAGHRTGRAQAGRHRTGRSGSAPRRRRNHAGTGRCGRRHRIGKPGRRLFGQLHRRIPRRIRKRLPAPAVAVRRPVLFETGKLLRLLLRHGLLHRRRVRSRFLRHLGHRRQCRRQSRLSHAVELLEQSLLLEPRFLFRQLLFPLLGLELGLQLGLELGLGARMGLLVSRLGLSRLARPLVPRQSQLLLSSQFQFEQQIRP